MSTRRVAAASLLLLVCAPLWPAGAFAATSPPPACPSPGQPAATAPAADTPAASAAPSARVSPASPAPAARATPKPLPTPNLGALCARQAMIDGARLRLNSNLASAMAVQERLTRSLEENAKQQAVVQARIVETQALLRALEDQLVLIVESQARTVAGIERSRVEAAVLARAIYRRPDSLLLAALRAQSLGQLISITADMLATGVRVQRSQRQLAAAYHRLEEDRSTAAAAQAAKLELRGELDLQYGRIQQLRMQQEESARLLAREIERSQDALRQLERQSGQLAVEIARALEEEQQVIVATAMQQAWAQVMLWEASPGHPAVAMSANHSRRYRFIWPEPAGVVSQRFGPTDLPLAPPYGAYPHFHTGLDIADAAGTTVLAADDGLVAVAGSGNTGYGNYVVLAHRDGLMTLYGHLQAILVRPGDLVTQRQPIGLEGSTGNSTGPHLHFELRIHDEPNDPALYLPLGAPSATGLDGS